MITKDFRNVWLIAKPPHLNPQLAPELLQTSASVLAVWPRVRQPSM